MTPKFTVNDFAANMASFTYSELRMLGQIGTTSALGLLFDTLIARSFMTPSIAVLLGRWFWWPVQVGQRPIPQSPATRTRPAIAVVTSGAAPTA